MADTGRARGQGARGSRRRLARYLPLDELKLLLIVARLAPSLSPKQTCAQGRRAARRADKTKRAPLGLARGAPAGWGACRVDFSNRRRAEARVGPAQPLDLPPPPQPAARLASRPVSRPASKRLRRCALAPFDLASFHQNGATRKLIVGVALAWRRRLGPPRVGASRLAGSLGARWLRARR